MIHHINKLQNKKIYDYLIDVEEVFDKTQLVFLIKILQRLGIDKTYLNIIKAIYEKSTANVILNDEKPKAFLPRSGTRQGCPFSPLSFNKFLEALAMASRRK